MEKSKKVLQATILVAALAMIGAGIRMDGVRDVLSKAIMICMECIGIG